MNVIQSTTRIASAQYDPLADEKAEQTLKEALDTLTYPFRFFRDYDEPNEIFAPRVALALPALADGVAALPIWPNIAKHHELRPRIGSAAFVSKETTMPKVRIPERLQELAGELGLDLGDQSEFTTDPHELIAWMHEQNHTLRCEENDERDEIDAELGDVEAEMLEATNEQD